jgi:poly(3-hydroxybutyrate) depolymerase
MIRHKLLAMALAAIVSTATPAAADTALPALCIDDTGVSVSGISSGGFMAHQFHIAHSARVMGAGVVAGGPYACAGGDYPRNLRRALSVCSSIAPGPFLGPPAAEQSVETARAAARANRIDDPKDLAGDRVFLFSGTQDSVVPTSVVASVGDVYQAFGNAAQTLLVDNIEAPHAMLTLAFGNPCGSMESPFINACAFDLAGATLKQIYGPLAPPKPASDGLHAFSQREFIDPLARHGLAERGFVYIPKACTEGARCRLHVAFHGCQQNEAMIGDAFIRHAGYNSWAEANDIVVLYPQTAMLTRRLLGIPLPWPNPQGCWDWWGYTGPHYADREGPQIKAVAAMIEQLGGRGRLCR